jgi:single-stranded-DNA-specific exonuclease
MMNGREAVDLLLARDEKSAKEKSANIDQYNDERREMDRRITEEANAIINNFKDIDDYKGIVVYNPDWHKGVIGIVASRLTEKYYRPSVVLTKSAELITGSARSIGGFDMYKAIESCRDLLENFGGHTYAAGLSLREENLKEFIERFMKITSEEVTPEQMVPQIDIDAVIQLEEINNALMNDLKKMNPFGPDNEKPVFCSYHVYDFGTSKVVGKDGAHLKLELIDRSTKIPVHAIAFGMSEYVKYIADRNPVDICYTIEENVYNGNTSIQLMIKDIRPSNGINDD